MTRFALLALLAFVGSAHAQPALVGPCMNNVPAGCSLTAPVIAGGTYAGGAINNTPIGNLTPSTGSFSTLGATGAASLLGGGTHTGTFTGGTFSGITLSGTIAGTPTLSGNLTFSGNPTFSGASVAVNTTLKVGSNTTGQTLQINGTGASSPVLEFANAGVKQFHWQVNGSFTLQGFTYDAAGANAVQWLGVTKATGAVSFPTAVSFSKPPQFVLGTVTVAGSDGGTPGTTQSLWSNETLSGSTSAAAGFVPNRFLMFDNLAITAQLGATQNPMFRYDLQVGGTAFEGGRSGVQVQMVTNADMPATTNSPLVAFQPKITATNNHSGNGGEEAFNPTCGNTSTSSGWTGGITCGEIDYGLMTGASPVQRSFGFFIQPTEDYNQQGHIMDATLAFSTEVNNGSHTSVGTRNMILIGPGKNPINPNNGAILATLLQAGANTDATAMAPMGAVEGFNLSNFATSDSVMKWSGGRLQNGEADHNFLAITQGATGPVLDASVQCVASAAWNSGTGYVQGEQVSDRLGGNLTLTTVVAGTPTVLSLANGQGACMKSGEVRTVARGMTIAPSGTGASILNIGALGSIAPGDTVLSPTTAFVQSATLISAINNAQTFTSTGTSTGAVVPVTSTTGVQDGAEIEGYGIPGGTTVLSHVLNTSITLSGAPNITVPSGTTLTQRPYVTLSKTLTGTIPVSSPMTFTLTGIPANPVEVIGGTGALGTVTYTWTTPTTMQIGASVNTIIGTGSALATNATSGFVLIPSMAGTPTGNVGALGKVALVWDSTNKKLCTIAGATVECSAAFTP